ncbi:MAG: hypothetical protein WC423_16155 [Vulcanimicrobiota bacterium]
MALPTIGVLDKDGNPVTVNRIASGQQPAADSQAVTLSTENVSKLITINDTLEGGVNLVGGEVELLGGLAPKIDAVVIGEAEVDVEFTPINVSASGDTTLVAAQSGKRIWVLGYDLVTDGDVTITFKSGSIVITGPYAFNADSRGIEKGGNGPAFRTVGGDALVMNLSDAVQVSGVLRYVVA